MGSLLKDKQICRFCASENKEYQNLYSESISCQKCDDECSVTYSQISNQYLKVKLEETSFYPRFSCFDCSCFLLKLVNFYKTLESGQSKLEDILIAEGRLEFKKRGRPRKGFEKNISTSEKPIENLHKLGKRKIKPPSRFQDATLVSVKSETVDDEKEKDSDVAVDPCADQPLLPAIPDVNASNQSNASTKIVYTCDDQTCDAVLKTKEELSSHMESEGHQDFIILEIENMLEDKTTGGDTSGFNEAQENFSEGARIYSCNEEDCERSFGSASSLAYHKSSAHKSSNFSCSHPGCNKTFKLNTLLKRHLATHNSERLYNCDTCGKSFKTKSNLQSHSVVHSDSKFFCEECGQQFKHRTSLAAHIRWHQGQKAHECPFCNKSFNQKGNLQEHIRIHTGDKPFKCHICGRTFTTSSQHRLHVKRHLGVKQFKCDLCDKTFLNKDSLKTHMRRHRGEKPFECQQCKKAFAESWALTKHMRSHSGQQPYLCKECGKRFADSSNLAKHRKTHEENAPKDKQEIWNIVKEAGDNIPSNVDNEDGEDVEQVIYITYENEDQNISSNNVKIVEISDANSTDDNQIKLTTKDGTQYRIVETLNFTTSSDYLKD